jgi:hypothetical protein
MRQQCKVLMDSFLDALGHAGGRGGVCWDRISQKAKAQRVGALASDFSTPTL